MKVSQIIIIAASLVLLPGLTVAQNCQGSGDTYTCPKPQQPQQQQQQQQQQPTQPSQRAEPPRQQSPQIVTPQANNPPPRQDEIQGAPVRGTELTPAPPKEVVEKFIQRKFGNEAVQNYRERRSGVGINLQTGSAPPAAKYDPLFDNALQRRGEPNNPNYRNNLFERGNNPSVANSGNNPNVSNSGNNPSAPSSGNNPNAANSRNNPNATNSGNNPNRIIGFERGSSSSAPPVVLRGGAGLITPDAAQSTVIQRGSIPGGIVLDGKATGLSWVKKVRYEPLLNAFVLDDRAVYLSPVSPYSAAVLLRAIAENDQVGVSLGGNTEIIYGKVPTETDVAVDLKLADHFLGDIVFASRNWSFGYRLPNNYEPQRSSGPGNVAVFFTFNDFEFAIKDEELRLTRAGIDVRIVPLTGSKAADGGHLPDLKAIATGGVFKEYVATARHIAENIGYYRRERIVDQTFAYGEVSAFFRGLKSANINLGDLAKSIEELVGNPEAGRVNTKLEDAWVEYLKDIQTNNQFVNWSAPPQDLYQTNKEQRAAAARSRQEAAAQVWAVTKDTTSVAILEDYIRQFGNTPYGSMARARVEELRKSQVAVLNPPGASPLNSAVIPGSGNCRTLAGVWTRSIGGLSIEAVFNANRSGHLSSGYDFTWACLGGSSYVLRSSGWEDEKGTLSADGRVLTLRTDAATIIYVRRR